MQEIVKETPPVEKNGLLSKAINAGAKAARTGMEGYCTMDAISRAIDDRKAGARRLLKKGRYAAADIIDDTTYLIKREPFRAVAVTFGLGMGIGMLTGWLVRRKA